MSKSRFKVGDRVREKSTGREGILREIDEGYWLIFGDDAKWIGGIRTDNLELVTETPAAPDLSSYETVALEELVDVLNPNDPFERVIMDMVATNRRKRADYAVDGSPWSNFDDTANALGIDGFTPVDSVNFNIEQKSARLRSLRKNGRMQDPRNESVTDTYLDRAVYAVIALAMHTYPTGKVETNEEDAA